MNFTVYKSSAGSGKTFTLVKEYLKIALNDDQQPPQKFKHILAITFTNKAADEMKNRVMDALRSLSDDSTTNEKTKTLTDILKQETGLSETIIQARAKNLLQTILHSYSDFAIGTIDSFVHKIIRTFAHDLHLPLNFEIETDSDKLLLEAIDLLINKIGKDELLTNVLVDFTDSKAEEEKSWHIEQDLFNFSKNLLSEDGIQELEKLKALSLKDFMTIRDYLVKQIKTFENSIITIAENACTLIKKSGVDTKSFYQGRSGIGAYFGNILKGRIEKLEGNSYVQTTIASDKWHAGKISDSEKLAIDSIKNELIDLYTKIQIESKKHYKQYNLFKNIQKNIYSLAVLNEIEKLLQKIKSQDNVIHISEFNRIISRIVSAQPAPFIYERIGEKYNHYLIDEFQDTSHLQWYNLLPLLENSLAEGNFNMLVGDGKQAIYRWRNGNVEQFVNLPEFKSTIEDPLIIERTSTFKRNYLEKQLNKNYRSKREIIEFNNDVFNILTANLTDDIKNIYKNQAQEFNPSNSGGYVEVNFIDAIGEEYKTAVLERTFQQITELKKESFKLNDICILCRSNKNGNDIAQYLSEKGIQVISSDSLLLGGKSQVALIANIINYLIEPSNKINKTAIIQLLKDQKLIKVKADYTPVQDLTQILKENNIGIDWFKLNNLPLFEMCEEIMRNLGLAETNDPYLQFFLEEVFTFSTKKGNSVHEFIKWWEERKNKASIIIPDNTDAVRIMTIHRSKGLEFPIVLFPFANWKISNTKENSWINLPEEIIPGLPAALLSISTSLEETDYADIFVKEKSESLLDNINLLYVASTRPIERLYIYPNKPGKTPEKFATISDILAYYYQQKNEWDQSKNTYSFGTKSAPEKYTNKTKELYQHHIHSSRWQEHLDIRLNATEVWDMSNAKTAQDYGLLVHKALSYIITACDIDVTIKTLLNQGIVDAQEADELKEKMNIIVQLPLIHTYFTNKFTVKNECDIVLTNEQTVRPDRLCFSENETIILDYKAGKKEEKHIKQIQEYANILTDIGYKSVKKYLVYIENEEVVEV